MRDVSDSKKNKREALSVLRKASCAISMTFFFVSNTRDIKLGGMAVPSRAAVRKKRKSVFQKEEMI